MASESGAVALLEDMQQLLQLKGENPFKVRAFERAAKAIAGHTDLDARARAGTLTELPGIGKGIAEVLTEFLLQGHSKTRDELRASLPKGLLELTQVPGLGPKKAQAVIDELGIHTLAELEYACRENRLLKLAGFGEKAQHKILEGVRFLKAGAGQQRISDVFPAAEKLAQALTAAAHGHAVCETGALRRRLEVLDGLDFLVDERAREAAEKATAKFRDALPVRLHFAKAARWGYELARTTATPEHWKALGDPAPFDCVDEEAFYRKLGLPFIPPEARETGEEVKLAREGKLDELLPWDGVRGVFHNHTTRSDGAATLEEMVLEAKRLGFAYIGISDHSQSAVYAHGLRDDDLKAQHREVQELQEKHPEIRIFWGTESDILADGSLDYPAAALKRFDFVVASVHSRFQMDRTTMTARIVEAVRNPATRFLGHATGRLLLGRPGYDLDMPRVIAEAAAHDVAIEINANPARLDIDWRWGHELRRRGTRVSINPDAHDLAGLADTRYGVAVARKALLPRGLVVNASSVKEVEAWLKRA